MNLLIDVTNAASMIGVDNNTMLGWCKNGIINCQNAPSDYAERTQFLIEERECKYLRGLVDKFGARKALLHYDKKHIGGAISNEIFEERKSDFLNLPNSSNQEQISLDQDHGHYEDTYAAKEKPNIDKRVGSSQIESSCFKTIDMQTNDFVKTIMKAHNLKTLILSKREELKQLEKQYDLIHQEIVDQL